MKKVAIVGFSDISRDLAPYDDPSWEIWGCNHVYQYAKRLDVIFELHKRAELETKYGASWSIYRDYLKNFKGTVYMQEPFEEIPNARPLPIEILKRDFAFTEEEIETTIGPADVRSVVDRTQRDAVIFKSTISYMVAMAIRADAKVIGIYGVDMSIDSEWFYQRHNLYFYLGWARGRGIEVRIPKRSHLMSEQGWMRLYGYDHDQVEKYKDLIADLRLRVKQYDIAMSNENARNEKMCDDMERIRGIIHELKLLSGDESFNGHREFLAQRRERYEGELEKLQKEQDTLLKRIYIGQGMRDEAWNLAERLGFHNRGEMPEAKA